MCLLLSSTHASRLAPADTDDAQVHPRQVDNLNDVEAVFNNNNKFDWLGPWGGPNGTEWSDGTYSSVAQINLEYSSSSIESIQIVYALKGSSGAVLKVSAPIRGGHGHFTSATVQFKEREILTGISGYYGYRDSKHFVVRSLSFHTNIQVYGPYGVQRGTYFESPSSAGTIVGFFGRSGTLLDAIGIYTLDENSQINKEALITSYTS
eukprot:Gb_17750 [translate_table: standard]